MSADRLREAARVLRERAQAATSGPWEASTSTNPTYVAQVGHLAERDPSYIAACGPASVGGDHAASYIATVHPGVGLALADWLDTAANNAERNGWMAGYTEAMRGTSAVRIADLILGGDR